MQEDIQDSAAFVREIINDANSGRGFVPFIGSGMSSASGIIMGMEFTNYLAFTTYLVLCDPSARRRTHGEGKVHNWSLKQQGWPPAPSQIEIDKAKAWIQDQFLSLCKRYKVLVNYDGSGNRLIQSLTHARGGEPLEELVATLTQPAIPKILKSWSGGSNDDEIKQLAKLLLEKEGNSSRENLSSFLVRGRVPGASYQEQVTEVGIRALSDWRETLTFLASVHVIDSGPSRLQLGDFDSSIIDDFNSTITRDKRPNLGHKIIAHLSEPLRVSTILTTNFDTLTEDAYSALSLPLRVLPVSTKGRLPNARTVASSDTLIKLHGEAHDTRADLSLDEEPDSQDKDTFCQYMTRGTGHLLRRLGSENTAPVCPKSNRLLVVGYSGSDFRCIQMMKHWLESTADDPKAYWICFSWGDVEKIRSLFSSEKYRGKVRLLLSQRPDLVLYELYQRLALSLPPGGLTYEFSHVLPPSRSKAYDTDEKILKEILLAIADPTPRSNPLANFTKRSVRDATVLELKRRILSAVSGSVQSLDDESRSVLAETVLWQPKYRFPAKTRRNKVLEGLAGMTFKPVVINAPGGVTRACAIAASEISRSQSVFWHELQDYVDADSFLRDLLRAIALRFGHFQSRHVTMHPFQDGLPRSSNIDDLFSVFEAEAKPGGKLDRLATHFRDVFEEYRVDASSIVVLLCGRDSYGNCSGILSTVWNDEEQFRQLHFVIEALGKIGVRVVYFPCTPERAKRKIQRITDVQVTPSIDEVRDRGTRIEWPHDSVWATVHENAGNDLLESDADAFSVFNDIIVQVFKGLFDSQHDESTRILRLRRPDVVDTDWVKRLEFIYAVTLFRHSRHPNSVCSEGVFPCPFRFKAQAIDNDFVRAIESERWIGELKDARAFFNKPGGAVWMHRDIRRTVFEVIDNTPIPQLRNDKRSGDRQHFSFREMRGRLHFWIGDWYFKAFCSSGHLTPVIECVYHLISAALHASTARPKRIHENERPDANLKNYRLMMFESSLMQATKSLLLSWNWMELWQASSASVGWLDKKARNNLEKQLTATIHELGCAPAERTRLESTVENFLFVVETLERAVKLEGGGSERESTSSLSKASLIAELSPRNRDNSEPVTLGHSIDQIRASEADFNDQIQVAFEKCNYGAEQLWLSLSGVAQGHRDTRDNFGRLKTEWKARAVKGKTIDAKAFHDLIWVLGESAYILLRRAKLEYHAQRQHKISNLRWLQSTICCNLGIDLCKHLPPSLLDYEVLSKSKLHSIYSVGLANLGRGYEATRHLNEAQAIVSKWQQGNARDIAILSLRRAEVKLTECFWISRFLRDPCSAEDELDLTEPGIIKAPMHEQSGHGVFVLPSTERGAVNCWFSGELRERLNQFSMKYPEMQMVPPKIFECFRSSRPNVVTYSDKSCLDKWREDATVNLVHLFGSVLDEGVRALEIAEKNLGGVSQSNLWWSRLRILQLRVYGFVRYLGNDAESCTIFRKRSGDSGIYLCFLAAARIAGEDHFRRLRALRYFLDANRWYTNYMDGNRLGNLAGDYLPDSFSFAQEMHQQLQRYSETLKGDDDLLKNAIRIVHEDYPELSDGL